MDKIFIDNINSETILARLNRATPDSLLQSLVAELVRLHQDCRSLGARLAALEVNQTVMDRVGEATPLDPATLPNMISIDAAFSLTADAGFHQLEYDTNGGPFRWTGPEPMFFFEVLMNRQDSAKLRMRYSKLYVEAPVHNITCYIDGQPVETKAYGVEGECEVHARVPARSGVGGTVVAFVCPQVQSPSDKEGSADQRKLGLAFRWLRIERDDSIFGDTREPPSGAEATPRRRRTKSAQA